MKAILIIVISCIAVVYGLNYALEEYVKSKNKENYKAFIMTLGVMVAIVLINVAILLGW